MTQIDKKIIDKNTIDKLRESPLFNLSLSSKELFHSEFIAWVGNTYTTEFDNIFREYLKFNSVEYRFCRIEREENHIDLTLYYCDKQDSDKRNCDKQNCNKQKKCKKQKILIENKVKSMAYRSQLEEYSNEYQEHSYILLSLSKPSFFDNKEFQTEKNDTWHYVSYTSLKEKLNKLTEQKKKQYHKEIIKDYIKLIGNLTEIAIITDMFEDGNNFDFHSKTTDKNYEKLENIRFHDFYLKRKYERLAFELHKKLKDRAESKDKLYDFGERLDVKKLIKNKKEENKKDLYVDYGMTRGTGLLDFKYIINEDLILGIQIQGEQYRMVVEGEKVKGINDEERGRDLRKKLIEDVGWFNFEKSFSKIINEDVYLVYPEKKEKKLFNQFGDTFFYRSIKLGTTLTVGKLLDIIVKDIELIESNIKELKEIQY